MKIRLFLFTATLFVILSCNPGSDSKPTPSEETTINSASTEEDYLKKGKTIAVATFTSLSGELQKALAKGGVSEALKYCNLQAMPLVDSLSKVHNASIRRTSLKVRNPKNAPSELEAIVLSKYEAQVNKGEELMPFVQEIDPNTIAFFAPIKANDFCLQCHGKVGENIADADYELLKKLYPEDQATGYSSGDWRGIWSIRFIK